MSTASRASFGPRAAQPLEYIEQRWADEVYTRGCYGCYLPPGAWTASRPVAAAADRPRALGRRRVRDDWSGYMDGAVRSGEQAAHDGRCARL